MELYIHVDTVSGTFYLLLQLTGNPETGNTTQIAT